MDKERLEHLLEAFGQQKVVVLGDLMLDRYVQGSVSRISPEAPVPVVHVRRERTEPGGAANVALNIQRLGGQALVVGIAGADQAGDDLVGVLTAAGIDSSGIVRDPALQTTVKTRILADRQQVVRVDREDPPTALSGCRAQLIDTLGRAISGADALIIEDYGKGIVCQPVVDAALALAAEADVPVALDPKDAHELNFSGLRLATPNYREACDAAGVPEGEIDEDLLVSGRLPDIAKAIEQRWHTQLLLVTLGPQGMYVVPQAAETMHIPTHAREVFDVSGAGDTVIATTMLALVAGADDYEAAALANRAAGVVVGKVGTATCSPEELMAAVTSEGKEES
jgi:rfaE bifunctional protein kinase chain/domain